MSILKNVFALCLLLSFVMVSCGKDDDGNGDGGPTPDPNQENYFACKIDGVDWVAESITQPTVTQATAAADVMSKRLDFFGKSAGASGMTLAIAITDYHDADEGECISTERFYGWDDPDYGDAFSVTSSTGTTFTSDATLSISGAGLSRLGSINVTNCEDGKISGTFSFTLKDLTGAVVHDVTEGVFSKVAYDFF